MRQTKAVANEISNILNCFLRDGGGAVLGSGTFPVTAATDGSGSFNASLTFNLPPNGGAVGLEIFEPGQAGGPVAASATLQLQVAPQLIQLLIRYRMALGEPVGPQSQPVTPTPATQPADHEGPPERQHQPERPPR